MRVCGFRSLWSWIDNDRLMGILDLAKREIPLVGFACEAIKIDQLKQIYSTHNKFFIEKGRHMQNVLKDVIDEGKESGELKTDIDSEEIVEYLFIALRGVIFDWCLHDGSYNLVEFVTIPD